MYQASLRDARQFRCKEPWAEAPRLPSKNCYRVFHARTVILTWPTNATGFTLQSTTNLGSSAVWTANSPAPVIVNGQNMVTNPISGSRQFYRLAR